MSESAISQEIAAMASIEQALSGLTEDERARVLTWAVARFDAGISTTKNQSSPRVVNEDVSETDQAAPNPSVINSLAEFYDAAAPSTDYDKVLVVGYWHQHREGHTDLDSQAINSELKHLGHGITNITRALDWHKSQKPALMLQKRKEGSTKQARKKFAVTNEGKKYVEKLIASKT